jgi:glycine cleavage system H protein
VHVTQEKIHMSADLQVTVGKFTFRVETECFYTDEGVWAKNSGSLVRVGLSDFLQQRSGDIAFVEIPPAGRMLSAGQEVASIETIKVSIILSSPLAGKVARINPLMQTAPEMINQDPYGEGWLCEIEPAAWEHDQTHLLTASTYFIRMKQEAENEVNQNG